MINGNGHNLDIKMSQQPKMWVLIRLVSLEPNIENGKRKPQEEHNVCH